MKKVYCIFLSMIFLFGCSQQGVGTEESFETESSGQSKVLCYPILFVDVSNQDDQAYVLCAFKNGELFLTSDFTYNENSLSEYLFQEDATVSSEIFIPDTELHFWDTSGERITTAAERLSCTGRIIDSEVEVRADLLQPVPEEGRFCLGTYSSISLFPGEWSRDGRTISVDLNANGDTDLVSWEFISAEEEYADYNYCTITVTVDDVICTINATDYLPCKEDELAVFPADLDQNGICELVVYVKQMSRFGTINVYQLCENEYTKQLTYIIDPEP